VARAEHKAAEADLEQQHRQHQAFASNPEGPAAPVVCREAAQIASASKPLKMTGFATSGGSANSVEGSGDFPRGCLSRRILCVGLITSLPLGSLSGTRASKFTTPPEEWEKDSVGQHEPCHVALND